MSSDGRPCLGCWVEKSLWIWLAFAWIGLTISNALVEIGAVAALAVWVFTLIRHRQGPSAPGLSGIFLALFLGWVGASLFHSAYVWESARGLFKVAKGAALFLAAFYVARDEKGFRRLMRTIGIAAALTFVSGLVQHLAGQDLFLQNRINPLDGFRRVSASFNTPNDLAGFLIPALVIVLGLGLAGSVQRRVRSLWLLAFVVGMFVLWRTSSRAGWICAATALLLFTWKASRRLFWVFVILLIALPFVFPQTIGRRLQDVMSLEQNPTWERLKLWQGAAAMIREHPVAGFGINTYSKYFSQFRPKDYFPDVRYAHNCYLQMASEIGWVGLAFFLLFVAMAMRRAGRFQGGMNSLRILRWALVSGLAGFILHAGLDTDLYSTRLASFFWMGLGLAVGAGETEIHSPRRIVVIRTDRIGELLLTTPAFQALKRAFPAARLTAVVSEYAQGVVAHHPDVDEVIALPGELHSRSFREDARVLRLLRERRFDMAIVFNPSKRFHLLTALAGIPVRVGYSRKWGFLLTHRVPDEKTTVLIHEIEHNLTLVRRLGIPAHSEKPVFRFTEEEARTVDQFLTGLAKHGRPLILLHAGGSHATLWPRDRYAALSKTLEKADACVLWIGSKEERSQTEACIQAGYGVNAAGKFSLGELGALIARADLLVGNDSSPMHLASALGTPTVALIPYRGPGSGPGRWGPWGDQHGVLGGDLTKVTVAEVEAAIRKILAVQVASS